VGDLTGHPYADWISTYGDPAFAASTEQAKQILDRTAAQADRHTPIGLRSLADFNGAPWGEASLLVSCTRAGERRLAMVTGPDFTRNARSSTAGRPSSAGTSSMRSATATSRCRKATPVAGCGG